MKLLILTSGFFVMLVTSCASYKAIDAGSIDHPSGTTPSIAPGDIIRLSLKSGESIKDLKVTAIDSERIAGTQTINLGDRWHSDSKIIVKSDIQSIEKRKISAGKTTALVVILVTSPLWIWALSGSPL